MENVAAVMSWRCSRIKVKVGISANYESDKKKCEKEMIKFVFCFVVKRKYRE